MMISEEKEETASDAKKSSENIIDFDLKTAIDVGNAKTIRLPFASNKKLREGFRESNAPSAVGHVINLISDWNEAGVPVFLNARNRTQADQCRELLDDLMIETLL